MVWRAFTDYVEHGAGLPALLIENWEGDAEIIALVREVLEKEADLIGDARDRMLRYVGLDALLA